MAKRALATFLLLAVVAGGLAWWRWHAPGVASPARPDAGITHGKYQCAMHPQIVSDTPGTCPICGMTLTPVEQDAARPGDAAAVSGRAPFTLSTERQQLIGVRRETVQVRPLAVQIRAIGTVAYDPELYEAVVEYQQAVIARERLSQSILPEARSGAEGLVRAALMRLRQKGIPEAQLAAIRRGGGDPTNLLLPGKSVWVYAQVYEYELGLIRPGQPLTVTAPSLPGRRFSSRVSAIDPILDPATRTARVRALVATPAGDLRPQSFVDVTIDVSLGSRLAVPQDAVLDTGTRRLVFVVRGEGRFEPREVQLGRDAQGFIEVLSGLAAGDEVVVGANFLIDSESRFRSALQSFESPGHRH